MVELEHILTVLHETNGMWRSVRCGSWARHSAIRYDRSNETSVIRHLPMIQHYLFVTIAFDSFERSQ